MRRNTLLIRIAYYIALATMIGSTWYLASNQVSFLVGDLYHVIYPMVGGALMRFILRRADLVRKPEGGFPTYLYVIAGVLMGVLVFFPYRLVSSANSLVVFYILYAVGGLLPFVKIKPFKNG